MTTRDIPGSKRRSDRISTSPKFRAATSVLAVCLGALTGGHAVAATPTTATTAAAEGAHCEQRSDPKRTAALLELYTSEGCSSCPPADKWLSNVRASNALTVPLSLHVDYWNYIGWRDPYSSEAYTLRQRWAAERNGTRSIYTPEVFSGGVEWRSWNRGFDQRIGAINARAPQADIRLAFDAAGASGSSVVGGAPLGRVAVDVQQTGWDTGGRPALFVALAESGLTNAVNAGENSGERLTHDHVVRQWIGPIELRDGKAVFEQSLLVPKVRAGSPDPASGQRSTFEVVAFVQDLESGGVLQATRLDLAACSVK